MAKAIDVQVLCDRVENAIALCCGECPAIGKRTGGSSLCHKALWQWMFARIEIRAKTSNRRILEIRSIYQSALDRYRLHNHERPKGVKINWRALTLVRKFRFCCLRH